MGAERKELPKITRRQFLTGSAALVGSALLSDCGNKETIVPSFSPPASPTSEPTPIKILNPKTTLEQTTATGITFYPEIEIPLSKEEQLEQAYEACFRKFEIAGQETTLRIPFAMWNERKGHRVYGSGKGNIPQLWEEIERRLNLPDFSQYLEALTEPKEKVVHFNLPGQKFSIITDKNLIERMRKIYSLRKEFTKTGKWALVNEIGKLYPGNDNQVYLLNAGKGFNEVDIYDFLYCLGGIGIDCSRFVYHCQQTIYGDELNIRLGKALDIPPQRVPSSIGTWFYSPSSLVERVEDKIINLRPGDVICFRGRTASHSAVIQSVDLEQGKIRYLQCTDWALQEERGVHESFISFDNPEQRLKDEGVVWEQQLGPTFPGETSPAGWRTDGDRYRGTTATVVRFKSSLTSGSQ